MSRSLCVHQSHQLCSGPWVLPVTDTQGLRKVNMVTGDQEPTPNIAFVPVHMQFDLLSSTLLMLVKG